MSNIGDEKVIEILKRPESKFKVFIIKKIFVDE